jgi:serine-type D-Ala-D-Ala carboxypeptidase/endopeptidase
LFEIGSLTKLFTANLLALLVEQGKLELNQPINQLGDIYKKLPNSITLESLATHTSGLPRLPNNLNEYASKNPQNPYAEYTFAALETYLQNHDGKPGKIAGKISYSNLGAGILGNILATQYGCSYESAIAQYISHPLGFSNTCITLTPEQQSRFAKAYSEDGKPISYWDIPSLAGAGALRSTVNDLLKFIAANLHPDENQLGQAILNTHQLRYNTFAPDSGLFGAIGKIAKFIQKTRGKPLIKFVEIGIGLGWFIDHLPNCERNVFNHTGGTGGHRSFCGFIPQNQTGVVILSNYGEVLSSTFGRYSIDKVGLKILEILR